MKKILTLLTMISLSAATFAQAPEKMSYQAVVRNAGNGLVTNQSVGIQISILQGSSTGSAVFVETHTATTNTNGLVTIEIGNGTNVSGNFSLIDWGNGPYFIKTETDPTGGTAYTVTGTSQLLSVPFALHAKTADSLAGGINYTETDPVFASSVASGINASDITNWNNHTVDTHIDSTGIAALGFVAGPHTVDTDTHIDSTGIAALGFVAGPHKWNANGNDISNNNAGKVGIGTTTPNSKLDVNGELAVDSIIIRNLPAFTVVGNNTINVVNNNNWVEVNAWAVLPSPTNSFNNNGDLNTTTGRFIAPRDGFYYFSCHLQVRNLSITGGDYCRILIAKNQTTGGQGLHAMLGNAWSATYHTISTAGAMKLSAGDEVSVYFVSSGADGTYDINVGESVFSGYLISDY